MTGVGRAERHRLRCRRRSEPSQGFATAPAGLICVLCVICGSKSYFRNSEAPALTAKQAVKQLEPQRTQRTQMAAELTRPTGARFDALCAAPTAVLRSRRSKSIATVSPGGEPMATSGEAASHGPVHAGPHGARLRVDHEMRNSCKDPMERASGRWGWDALDVWRPRNGILAQDHPGDGFDKSRSYPMQLSGDRCGWMGRAVVPVDAPRCVFDKSRSYPMQLFGGRCRRVHAGAGRLSASDRGGTLGHRMRSGELRQDTMIREAVRLRRADAGVGSVASFRQGGRSGMGCDRLNSDRIP